MILKLEIFKFEEKLPDNDKIIITFDAKGEMNDITEYFLYDDKEHFKQNNYYSYWAYAPELKVVK